MGIGVAVILIAPFVKKWMHLETLAIDTLATESERVFGDAATSARPAE
jgi:hypothetical protein